MGETFCEPLRALGGETRWALLRGMEVVLRGARDALGAELAVQPALLDCRKTGLRCFCHLPGSVFGRYCWSAWF